MHLYLIRHGLASWPNWTGHDAERPLTPQGARLMEAAGAGLARRLTAAAAPWPDLILHSPLLRAQQTAVILARWLNRQACQRAQAALAPGFDERALPDLLAEHKPAQALALIGHNPDMADLVSALAGQSVRFSEGTVAHLELDSPARARLMWAASAEELARPA